MNLDGTCEGPFTSSAQRLVEPAWRPGASASPAAVACVDLRVTVAASTDAVGLKQTVVFHVQIDNDGDQTATGVKLSIGVVSGAVLSASLPGCTRASGFVCRLSALPPGLSTSFELYASSARAGALNTLFTASSDQTDSDETSNTTRASATVLPCTTVGTLGNDAINGTSGRDLICARAGWDRINALGGDDVIDAGSGNDTVDAGKGRDRILGGGGDDVILAHDGQRDTIDCGAENDVVLTDRIDQVAKSCEQVIRYQ
jgi:Ca2+-binding RTX toxin-like protein